VVSGSSGVRSQEAGFLGRPLTQWASDLVSSDVRVQRSAAFALGKIEADPAYTVPRLIHTLRARDAAVREAAAFALGEIGPEAAVQAFTPLHNLLANNSRDIDPRVRRSAAFALGSFGLQATAPPALL